MKLSESACIVLEDRYLRDNETVEDMVNRVAHNLALNEKQYDKFFKMIFNQRFLPNSPTLRSSKYGDFFFACYNVPINDDLHSIKTADYWASMIHQSGGGTGFNFSGLRPKGDLVKGSEGQASGPVSFMRMIDYATGIINQGGYRRGANMGILETWHPDIREFVLSKAKNGGLSNFNLSIGASNNFMKCVEENKEYNLVNPRTDETWGTMNARDLLMAVAYSAWEIGCPGIVFTSHWDEKVTSTNPCGEMPLEDWESCNLGSLNLSAYTNGKDFNRQLFRNDVKAAVHFLDNAIDKHTYLKNSMRNIAMKNRKIGLGVMGFADMLYKMKIPYGGNRDCIGKINEIMNMMVVESIFISEQIGGMWEDGRRNKTLLSIAPTGTISIIAGCSSSIEPVFALVYMRNQMDGKLQTVEINPIFKEYLDENFNEPIKGRIISDVLAKHGSCQGNEYIPEDMQKVFVTAHDIGWKDHIDVQAQFQVWIDNAVSKTINFGSDSTPEDFYDAFMYAWKKGCKGITGYRNGSHKDQVLNLVDGSCPSGVCEM